MIKIPDEDMELFESIEMPYIEQYGEVNNHMYFVNATKDPDAPHHPEILLKKKK